MPIPGAAAAVNPVAAIGTGLDFIGGERANEANLAAARETRAWQEEMAKKAHQYEVTDLMNAGLNPILSAGGSGMSTPSGATAKMENTISPALSGARQTMTVQKELAQADAGIAKTKSDIGLNSIYGAAAAAGAQKDQATARETNARASILEKTSPTILKRNQYESKQIDFDSKVQDYKNVKDLIDGGLGTINSAIGAATRPWLNYKGENPKLKNPFTEHGGGVVNKNTGQYYGP